MKKKTFVALLLSILAVFCIFALVACNNKPGETEESTEDTAESTEKVTETTATTTETTDTETGTETTGDTEPTESEPCKHEETIVIEAVAPTCTKTGRTEGLKCANDECGLTLTQPRLLAANGHSYDVDLGKCVVCDAAIEFTVEGVIYELNDAKDGYVVKGFEKDVSWNTLAIPSTYKDLPVVAIANGAFENSSITNIILSKGMKTIGDNAFKKGLTLKEILLSDTVTSIGASAFEGCDILPKIDLRKVTSLGANAFAGCKALATIEVDEANGSFSTVNGILYNKAQDQILHIPASIKGDIVIPDPIKEIGKDAFKGASGITSITLGKDLRKIGENAFLGCSALKKVTAPDLATWLAIEFNGMFSTPCYYAKALYIGENKLSGEVTIPAGTEAIGAWAFAYFSDITNIVIPNTVKSIGSNAFYGCKGLVSVALPEGLETIGYSAFYYCDNIEKVIIPSTVKVIDERAFKGCEALISIQFNGTKAEWNAIEKGGFWDDNTGDYVITFAE